MRAAVLRDVRQIEISDVPDPDPLGTDSVLVKIAAVGVCGSDVLRFGIGKGYGFPLVLGHEMSGVAAEPSADGRISRGDRVAIFPCLPEADDPMTEIGEYALGANYDYFGSRRDGGLQEMLRVPSRNLFKLRDDISLLEGALVEPAGVALHAVRKAPVPPNATALVIGAGPIGLLAAQWLRVGGVVRVLVADIDPRKRGIAEHLGFESVDPTDVGSDVRASELTGGRGVDIAVEASGLAVTFLQAIHATAHRGHVVLLGDLSNDVVVPKETVSRILRREITLHGTWNANIAPRGSSDWDMVIASLGRTVNVRDLVSRVAPFDDAQHVFEELANRTAWANKTVFAVSADAQDETEMLLASSASAQEAQR